MAPLDARSLYVVVRDLGCVIPCSTCTQWSAACPSPTTFRNIVCGNRYSQQQHKVYFERFWLVMASVVCATAPHKARGKLGSAVAPFSRIISPAPKMQRIEQQHTACIRVSCVAAGDQVSSFSRLALSCP